MIQPQNSCQEITIANGNVSIINAVLVNVKSSAVGLKALIVQVTEKVKKKNTKSTTHKKVSDFFRRFLFMAQFEKRLYLT